MMQNASVNNDQLEEENICLDGGLKCEYIFGIFEGLAHVQLTSVEVLNQKESLQNHVHQLRLKRKSAERRIAR